MGLLFFQQERGKAQAKALSLRLYLKETGCIVILHLEANKRIPLGNMLLCDVQ